MPGTPQFDVDAARKSGASDDEILSYLSQRSPNFDVQGALKQASKQDVIGYLAANSQGPAKAQKAPPPAEKGALGKIWDWANEGIVSKDTFVRAMTGMTGDQLNEALKSYPQESPVHAAIREFTRGGVQDTGATASSFTSPLAVATMTTGAAGKIPGAVGKIAKVITGGAAAGFGVQGGREVAANAPQAMAGDPEAAQRALTGAAMVAGGAAGVGETMRGVQPPSPRGALSGKMAEVPPGEQFSRGEVMDAAREHGVNLDLAQATGSKVAAAAKKANQYSLMGSSAYSANATRNVSALEQWADGEASRYSPNPAEREVVGGQIKQKLADDLAQRKADASNAFNQLDQTVGSNVLNGAPIEGLARKIVGQNGLYYRSHPELKPTKSWAIIEDLAKRPTTEQSVPVASGAIDASGNPIQAGTRQVPAAQRTFSWSELHQLRSDLMDFYRNNPDIVKGRGEAWIQQMVGKIDSVMTDSANGLSPADLQQFRSANQAWESLKGTYDNPQSPLFHVVRAPYPSQVPAMLTKGTPELARQVRSTLGSLEGPFQRQFVENLLNDKNGGLDLGKLDMKLSRIPNDFLESMVGPDGAKNLKLLGKVSRKVMADANPSGTAKVGVPAAEVTSFFHNPIAGAAEMGAQYGASKAINSPKVVDYLTGR